MTVPPFWSMPVGADLPLYDDVAPADGGGRESRRCRRR